MSEPLHDAPRIEARGAFDIERADRRLERFVTHDHSDRVQVSEFFGIDVGMSQTDRFPAHFHASYERHEALIAIDTLEFIDGWVPKRAYALVLEWAAQHRAELRANWDRARQGLPLERIVPLE